MPHPTPTEIAEHAIQTHRAVELGIGEIDTSAALAAELAKKYPDHLILIQAGKFMHGYDRTAYALHALKKYKLRLAGPNTAPHLVVGFPVAGHQRRLWKVMEEFGIPYVVALGTQKTGHTVYESKKPRTNCKVLIAVSPSIVEDTISDLRKFADLNATAATQLLAKPDQAGFLLKDKLLDLDTALIQDVAKMPRDLRATFGENIRATMHSAINAVMRYGMAEKKTAVLREISADIDQLKHYLAQSQKLSQLKGKFEHRAGLAVEIGRLVGGLINKEAS